MRLLIVPVLGLSLALSACGGGSNVTSSSSDGSTGTASSIGGTGSSTVSSYSTGDTSTTSLAEANKTFAPDDGREIRNPERGLYLPFYTPAEPNHTPLSLSRISSNLDQEGLTLMLRLYFLHPFIDQPLSQAQLDLIRSDFAVMREAGIKGVIRFAYANKSGEPDAPLDVVLGHMEQLRPIMQENADVILTAQAGFIGEWGEWCCSSNGLNKDPAIERKIMEKWLDILPATRTVQLRTHYRKWEVLGSRSTLTPELAFQDSLIARIGHHNDCFLSSEDDYGTYHDIENDKRHLNLETKFVPWGGETCALTEYSAPANARAEMENLHSSYLNLDYHHDVIDMWRAEGFLNEVKNRLGYRLSLDNVALPNTVAPGSAFQVVMNLKNSGFAAPFNPRNVQLILKSQQSTHEVAIPVDVDPRTWLPGSITVDTQLSVPGDLPLGKYSVWLALPDPEPKLADRAEYAIQLANPGLWDATTGQHDLGMVIEVTNP